ncbi:vWA domain-containing protein [Floccifex sp.]|uniref:vWA domain-containing protein n=1 Tax=Floccifex sp. TaxID=2815810 RepID=UPI003EFE0273
MKHIQTQREWEQNVSFQIIQYIQSELFLDLPYMSIPIHALEIKDNEKIHNFATDGIFLYYSMEQVLRLFSKNPLYLNRSFLHSILHCVFSHLWICSNRNIDLWNLACDICVEYTIDHMEKKSVKRILSWLRKNLYDKLENEAGVSASQIYCFLLDLEDSQIQSYVKEFICDDHRYWPKTKEEAMSPSCQSVQRKWNQIASEASLSSLQQGNQESDVKGSFSWQIRVQKSTRNYKEFLKKFMVIKEERKINEDEFDLSYYSYGLRLYENLPLIEPLETKEEKKIQEIVIVLDTSYSTNGLLLENFLKETFAIFHSNVFFSKSCIHLIQCDNQIQKHEKIHNEKEMEEVLNHFKVHGGNGTDFRVVFSYIEQCQKEGTCKDIAGLLYFTDGLGIYPKNRPKYPCAFLFLDDYDEKKVPVWAMRIKLDPVEFMGEVK